MVLGLLYKASKIQKEPCDVQDDRLTTLLIVSAITCAILFHGNLDDHAIFDTLWMFSTFVGAIAVLPQLILMTRSYGYVPALTSHFIAMMALGRVLSGFYMWHARDDIDCDPWVGKFNHAGAAVLGAHMLHLLLLADFAYYYCKNVAIAGLHSPLGLPQMV